MPRPNQLALAGLCAVLAVSGVHGHGYLSYPPPRGIQVEGYQVDLLKSPNNAGLCRGLTFETGGGHLTTVSHNVSLGMTITAPHVGPCKVTIMNPDNSDPREIASMQNCAAPGNVGKWDITIPADITGRKVLRWQWEGCHVTPCEPYEQCSDIIIGGGGAAGGNKGNDTDSAYPTPTTPSTPSSPPKEPSVKAYEAKPSAAVPKPPAAPSPAPAPSAPASSSCENGKFACDPAAPSKYRQCSNGAWVTFDCPVTLKCSMDATIGLQCVGAKVY